MFVTQIRNYHIPNPNCMINLENIVSSEIKEKLKELEKEYFSKGFNEEQIKNKLSCYLNCNSNLTFEQSYLYVIYCHFEKKELSLDDYVELIEKVKCKNVKYVKQYYNRKKYYFLICNCCNYSILFNITNKRKVKTISTSFFPNIHFETQKCNKILFPFPQLYNLLIKDTKENIDIFNLIDNLNDTNNYDCEIKFDHFVDSLKRLNKNNKIIYERKKYQDTNEEFLNSFLINFVEDDDLYYILPIIKIEYLETANKRNICVLFSFTRDCICFPFIISFSNTQFNSLYLAISYLKEKQNEIMDEQFEILFLSQLNIEDIVKKYFDSYIIFSTYQSLLTKLKYILIDFPDIFNFISQELPNFFENKINMNYIMNEIKKNWNIEKLSALIDYLNIIEMKMNKINDNFYLKLIKDYSEIEIITETTTIENNQNMIVLILKLIQNFNTMKYYLSNNLFEISFIRNDFNESEKKFIDICSQYKFKKISFENNIQIEEEIDLCEDKEKQLKETIEVKHNIENNNYTIIINNNEYKVKMDRNFYHKCFCNCLIFHQKTICEHILIVSIIFNIKLMLSFKYSVSNIFKSFRNNSMSIPDISIKIITKETTSINKINDIFFDQKTTNIIEQQMKRNIYSFENQQEKNYIEISSSNEDREPLYCRENIIDKQIEEYKKEIELYQKEEIKTHNEILSVFEIEKDYKDIFVELKKEYSIKERNFIATLSMNFKKVDVIFINLIFNFIENHIPCKLKKFKLLNSKEINFEFIMNSIDTQKFIFLIIIQYDKKNEHYFINFVDIKQERILILNSISYCIPMKETIENNTVINQKDYIAQKYYPNFECKEIIVSQQSGCNNCFYYATLFSALLVNKIENETVNITQIEEILDKNLWKYKSRLPSFWKTMVQHIIKDVILIEKYRFIKSNEK